MTGAGSAPTRLVPVIVPGPAGKLEGLLQTRDPDAPAIAALVCHPHPAHGGTLHNKVTHRAASTLFDLGASALRFNFRGVGKSEGSFDDGRGELEDARAALAYLRDRYPHARVWLAGFSFGSWIAARLASDPSESAKIERLILIAPPIHRANFETLRTLTTPKLVVQGTADDLCPHADLEREFPTWAEPKEVRIIEGATHFFDKRLGDLSHALVDALSPVV
jgi:alpha/beta superfamily hydrolase